jgi:hypothetical protein
MKKKILSFALVATMIGAIATGCGSAKEASDGSDTSKSDTSSATRAPATDTPIKKDTTKTDTGKRTPQ